MPVSWPRALSIAALGAALALAPALVLFDFTVDDALIPARYATHLARGLGYRWNAHGPITDAVTPLGFPYLLAPFAARGPLHALAAAKVLGLLAWTAAAGLLAVTVDRASSSRLRWSALVLLPASAPLAAWSVAGLETGLAAALVSLAVCLVALGRPTLGAFPVGLAAALRPELLPFALLVAITPPPGESMRLGRAQMVRVALAAAPFFCVVAIRLAVFGRPTPLAVLAKPSDPWLGAKYALACFLLTGPLALVAPRVFLRSTAFVRGLVLAVAVHFAAVAVAGGDWMPLSRLVVPVLPAVILAAAHIAAVADARMTALRITLVVAGELFVMVKIGPAAARVGRDRAALVREIGPALEGARVVATLDAGWVGAATEANIVDLAGLTDPAIAALPGGHTTKRIAPAMLDARGVDSLVLLLARGARVEAPWTASRFDRGVEARIASFPAMAESFVVTAESRVPGLPYVVLRRRDVRGEPVNARGLRVDEPRSAPEPVNTRGLRADEPRSAPEPVNTRGLRADEPRSAPEPP
ncbi:hypothetical protein [Polyangium spumosum]|uniref:DUF2029 domain-containing protein n=1 Tax=Polyangium spumosum TaxID=889282 RepID=A0A6N7PF60_9BACT|nr:hypothetical protein [Polyangium spumosum]MRG90629.1 hypothetical protein [Polyangium spumosum]